MDTTFSVYSHALKVAEELTGSIQDIGGVERYEPNLDTRAVGFGTKLGGMLHWCRVVEKLIPDRDLRDAEVQVGFEKLSRMQKATQRYLTIGSTVSRLVVFGAPDAPVPVPVAHVVPVLDGPLCEEWFLIVRSARYSALIAARDLDGLKQGSWQKARRFKAVATHDSRIIDATASALDLAASK